MASLREDIDEQRILWQGPWPGYNVARCSHSSVERVVGEEREKERGVKSEAWTYYSALRACRRSATRTSKGTACRLWNFKRLYLGEGLMYEHETSAILLVTSRHINFYSSRLFVRLQRAIYVITWFTHRILKQFKHTFRNVTDGSMRELNIWKLIENNFFFIGLSVSFWIASRKMFKQYWNRIYIWKTGIKEDKSTKNIVLRSLP